jgi:hypothetical protein
VVQNRDRAVRFRTAGALVDRGAPVALATCSEVSAARIDVRIIIFRFRSSRVGRVDGRHQLRIGRHGQHARKCRVHIPYHAATVGRVADHIERVHRGRAGVAEEFFERRHRGAGLPTLFGGVARPVLVARGAADIVRHHPVTEPAGAGAGRHVVLE